jgi:hypothetical protein
VVVTVMFEEHVSRIGGGLLGFTVTVKVQFVTCPQELVAVQVTIFVPKAKQLPLGGLQTTLSGVPHPPLAVLV